MFQLLHQEEGNLSSKQILALTFAIQHGGSEVGVLLIDDLFHVNTTYM